jgi:hypothetical protein
MESGHAAQNICLQAVVFGLDSVTIGAFADREVAKILKIENNSGDTILNFSFWGRAFVSLNPLQVKRGQVVVWQKNKICPFSSPLLKNRPGYADQERCDTSLPGRP